MFQTSVLMSGSRGNSMLVRTKETAVLLDAGVSKKAIFAALDSLGVSHTSLKAIIVSHEHSDHILGVGIVARALKIPVFINADTYASSEVRLGKLPVEPIFFETGESFQIGDLFIHPFSSSHDAVDSCNFTFIREGDAEKKLGVATDLGYPTRLTVEKLKNCSTIVLESNHDPLMLMTGPYDPALKQRVKSKLGHLSNTQAAELIQDVIHHGLQNLILAHISEQNNLPALALSIMQKNLAELKREVNLLIALQDQHTPLIDI